ncbi:MAG: sulfate ABC transporter substrate-binding protein [Clostridiales bacterium]|nr:sulfate ABC transporter substrate-binding protein [Clostridiales bacterium]
MMKKKILRLGITVILIIGSLTACGANDKKESVTDKSENKTVRITDVSYDLTRELYEAYNQIFAEHWKEKTGQDVEVIQSHGGSGKQALEVANGLEADVVTLALKYDVKAIEKAGLIKFGWTSEFEADSSPYTSTIVFLIKKGNLKNIHNWDDVVKDGVRVITPNPKTSGGARWNYLAAWAFADKKYNGDEQKVKEFMKKLYENVLVLDSGARGATTSFVENGQGDVLLAWENEAYLLLQDAPEEYEIITPWRRENHNQQDSRRVGNDRSQWIPERYDFLKKTALLLFLLQKQLVLENPVCYV